jgi:hypothetical protein
MVALITTSWVVVRISKREMNTDMNDGFGWSSRAWELTRLALVGDEEGDVLN